MKKIMIVLLILLLAAGAAFGGVHYYLSKSKTPTAIAARTMTNLREVESVSMNMQVETGVRAEVSLLQFFGIKDPETTISMNYDIEMYKEPALMHTYVNVSAFDTEALKNMEVVVADEDGKAIQYYCVNDKWFRYVPDMEASGTEADASAADEIESEEQTAESESGVAADAAESVSPSMNDSGSVPAAAVSYKKSGAASGKTVLPGKSQAASGTVGDRGEENAWQETAEAVDFDVILQGISDGSLAVTLQEETEMVNEKECFVFDIDLTGDMFEKVIRISGGNEGLIPKLKEDEHVTGRLYIDSEKNLPAALTLSTGEIFSEKLNFEQIGTSLSVTKVDINVNVTGYNLDGAITVPGEYVDVDDLREFTASEMLRLVMEITGLSDILGDAAA